MYLLGLIAFHVHLSTNRDLCASSNVAMPFHLRLEFEAMPEEVSGS